MTILRVCSCGALVQRVPCPACTQRKQARRAAGGYHTDHWKRLRLATLNRDGWLCADCGQPANTVHIRPELKMNHRAATLADTTSLCRPCHGRRDGARAAH